MYNLLKTKEWEEIKQKTKELEKILDYYSGGLYDPYSFNRDLKKLTNKKYGQQKVSRNST